MKIKKSVKQPEDIAPPPKENAKSAKKVRLPKIKSVVPPVPKRFRKPTLREQTDEALMSAPRITNDTVAEHREKVLKGARKYKYPLEQSKKKIVFISTTLLIAAVAAFFIYSVLSLYKFQTTSYFMYRVAQIIPFPIAKAGKYWVSYESYLSELRRYIHYYETQQQVVFSSKSGKMQLASQKPIAMREVVNNAYVKDLARQNGIIVREQEIDRQIDALRIQNRLSRGDEELASIIRKFYGWSLADLRSALKDRMLAQKVVAKLDTEAASRANGTLVKLRSGGDFAELAKQSSDDMTTKDNGGVYNDGAITTTSQEVPPEVVQALRSMQPNDISEVITTPTSLEIVKLLSVENGAFKAAHIQIKLKDISVFTAPLAAKHPAKYFISLPKPQMEPGPMQPLPAAPAQ